MEAARTYSIAGFRVRMAGGAILRALGSVPGFREFAFDGDMASATPDLEFRMDSTHASGTPRGIHPSALSERMVHTLSFAQGRWIFEMHGAGMEISPPLARVEYFPGMCKAVMSCGEGAVFKFAAWAAFSLFAVGREAVPIHASAVVHRGAAVLFLGESGTGKSTHTRLWIRHLDDTWLLNDDSPMVRVHGDGIFAYGSPWSGKTPCYCPERVPLAAMVRLRQGGKNKIEQLGGARAIGALWPSCPPLLAGETALSSPMLGVVGHLVAGVPVYSMECRPDAEAAEVACNAIFGTR